MSRMLHLRAPVRVSHAVNTDDVMSDQDKPDGGDPVRSAYMISL